MRAAGNGSGTGSRRSTTTGTPLRAVLAAAGEVSAWAAVLFGVTVVSISSVGPVESAVAGAAALGGALAARAVRRAMADVPAGGRGALRAAAVLPWTLLRGLGLLALAAFRGPAALGARGPGIRRIALREGTGPGWAGLVLAASPDTCVIGADRGQDGHGATVAAHVLRQEPTAAERAVARNGGAR